MTLQERFDSHWVPEPNTGCHLWTSSVDGKGYGRFGMGSRVDDTKQCRRSHRVAWFLRFGSWPTKGLCCCHRCDTPCCVNPDHLFLGTIAENTSDMIAKGRAVYPPIAFGETNAQAKLTEADVIEIRARLAAGELQRIIAADFGVRLDAVSKIKRGERWRNVP